MAVWAHGDLFGGQGRISIDQNFQPSIIAVQAVSARRQCPRKMQTFVEVRFTSIRYDLLKGLSSTVERGRPQLTKTELKEGERIVSNFLGASSHVAQESCHDSPQQSFVRGKELPIAYAIADLKNRQQQGIRIDSYTLVDVLKRCSEQKDLVAARQVHECIIQIGMDQHPYVVNTLMNLYVRCGKLQDARSVFDRLEKKTDFTWSIMIKGYAKSDHAEDAVAVFNVMRQKGAKPHKLTCLGILKACRTPVALQWGKEVHAYIRNACLESDVHIGTALVQMYAKCGCITEARRIFEKLTNRNLITWNVMIGAYAESGFGVEAYGLFLQMKREGFMPDAITYLNILNSSACAGALEWVMEIHSHALKAGLESDLRVGNALVHMYARSGSIDDARRVFNRMEKRDVVTWTAMIGAYAESGCIDDARRVFNSMEKRDVITWNAMIGAYAESGCGAEAYELFLQMKREGFIPNAITCVCILNASASEGALYWVKEVHSHALKVGLESDLRVGNALVHMYAKCGSIDDARLVFNRMEKRDVITWNVMIGAYAETGCGVVAYGLFLQMKREGFIPDAITCSCILNASASAGALEWVKEVHAHARRAGLESDLRVGNALVHMYAKCGSIDDARVIFNRMEKRDVVSWNIMIGGLAQHGCGHEALKLFRKMDAGFVVPDETTFVAVLSGCCHAGLLDDGRRVFLAMTEDYSIEPDVEHYNCMVDLLGRAGVLEEAKLFIADMPIEPDAVTWGALLGACRIYGNVELGELAAKERLKLEPGNASTCVLLSNIYAAAGKWENVSLMRTLMEERGVRKEAGLSWIEVDNKIHEFVVGDTSHPESKAIYIELNELTKKLKAEGYIPDTQLVLQNISEEDKVLALCSHSEKLAIAYGLMRTPRGKPIRVYKNLRVCSDCHRAIKFISKVTGREVIARDANRFHHFKDGVCSCGDYW